MPLSFESNKSKAILIVFLVALGVMSRLFPYAPNVMPITAIALFASAYLGLRYSLVVLFSVMLISDVFIGLYHLPIMIAVYGSFALSATLGTFINKQSAQTIAASALLSSLAFFLITNWAVWQFGTLYERSLSGLFQSYVMAIPFFKNSLTGDLFYTAALFGVAYVASVCVAKQSAVKSLVRTKPLCG